ncbi:hypothetical protein [Pelagibius sp.]|uniref:hypothetical protein n=1 Tax=Pelagibius sp. TaxID=1931238 RepID=UPI00261D79F4|nr:hypothetical protein [Pelagibius sp.]
MLAGIYAGPTLVYALAISILQFSVSCEGEIYSFYIDEISRLISDGERLSSGEYGGFYFSATLVFIYVACILGFLYSLIAISKELQGQDFYIFCSVACMFSGIGMAALVLLPNIVTLCVVELYFRTPLNLIGELQDLALGGRQLFKDTFLVWAFLVGVFISNLAWWFVAAAGAVALLSKRDDDAQEDAYDLAIRLARVRQIMYAAALVLISNTFCISAWLRWPSSYVHDEVLALQLSGFGATLSFYYGTTMTVILGVVFLPVLYILGERSFAVARRQDSLKTFAAQSDWLEAQGLSIDFQARLRDLATILAPMLAGSLTDVVDTLT